MLLMDEWHVIHGTGEVIHVINSPYGDEETRPEDARDEFRRAILASIAHQGHNATMEEMAGCLMAMADNSEEGMATFATKDGKCILVAARMPQDKEDRP